MFLNRAAVKLWHQITGLQFGSLSRSFIGFTILLLPLSYLEYSGIWFSKFHLSILPKDSYYWLFSSISQSIAALLGLGGLFAAHMLQGINKKIDDALEKAKRIPIGKVRDSLNVDEALIAINELIEESKNDIMVRSFLGIIEKAKSDLQGILAFKDIATKIFKIVLVYMAAVIILSLAALPFSDALSKLTCGFLLAACILILAILSLLKMCRLIWGAVHG